MICCEDPGLPALLCHLDPGREGLWKLSLIMLTVLDPKRQACCSVVPDVLGAEKDTSFDCGGPCTDGDLPSSRLAAIRACDQN